LRPGLPGASQRRWLALVPAVLILLIGALAYQRSRTVVGEVRDVERSHDIIETSDALLIRAVDAETGQRAYLLTGDTTFLQPYRGARADIDRLLGSLRALGAGDGAQTSQLNRIDSLVRARFTLLDGPIVARARGQRGSWEQQSLQGKNTMDELRAAIASLQSRERRALAVRHAGEQGSLRNAMLAVAISGIAGLLISALINLAFARAVADRDRAYSEMKDVNHDLERQSEELEMQAMEMESQAAELEATAEDLRSTNDELNRTAHAAEAALEAAEKARRQLESVLDNLPDAANLFDSAWRWTYANPAAKRILEKLGVDVGGFLGKVLWRELPQLKGTRFETETLRAFRENKPLEFEEYFTPMDVWTENSVIPVGDSIMTVTRDITRHKREQEGAKLLSDASRVLASTLDYEKTLDAVARLAVGDLADWCAVDLVEAERTPRQVVVAHIDPAKVKWARELNLRYPPDYNAPTGVGQVIRTGQPEIYPEIPEELLAAGARDEEHLRIIRELQIRSALIVPMNARGRTLGALTLISTEKGRRYNNYDLELAVELATRAAIAIDNAQLYRSALAASDAKSAFLATMSHELRTPLNAIIGYQSLLQEGIAGSVNDAQLSQLSRIRASADHLLGLIDEVLTFSRVEAGKEVVRRESTRIKPLVEEAMGMIRPLAEAKGLAVRSEGVDAELFTDPGKVRQILLNLLSNAVKFTDEGEVAVRSYLNGDRAAIAITDSGIGIAPENLEKIFDPFWQVEQRSTRKVGGTGLGLSVSRSLARLLGGEVTVKSELDKGSTFTVSLPLRRG
jgi:signal transduction histidine kinase/CHASE3 domain sensor protein